MSVQYVNEKPVVRKYYPSGPALAHQHQKRAGVLRLTTRIKSRFILNGIVANCAKIVPLLRNEASPDGLSAAGVLDFFYATKTMVGRRSS